MSSSSMLSFSPASDSTDSMENDEKPFVRQIIRCSDLLVQNHSAPSSLPSSSLSSSAFPAPSNSKSSFVTSIWKKFSSSEQSSGIGPFYDPETASVKYFDPQMNATASLGICRSGVSPAHDLHHHIVKVYFSLTAFPNDDKDHYLHSALLFETPEEGSYFHLRNSHGEYQEGKYFVLDAHEGIMGATVGSDRREISKAMLNLEEKWIARHDSYDIFVCEIVLTRSTIENICKVIVESGSRVFTLPVQQTRVKLSIFMKGIIIQKKSNRLNPYNNCGMFNIRCLKALGIDQNPLDLLVEKERNLRRVFGMAILRSMAKKTKSIDESMKRDLLDEGEFFLLSEYQSRVSHHKGLVSYDYSDPRVFENAMKSMRNWVLLMKSLWHAL